MAEILNSLSEHNRAFSDMANAIEGIAGINELAPLSPQDWEAAYFSSKNLMAAGLVYAARFRPLLTPFTAETELRPMPAKRIGRNVDIILDQADAHKLYGFVPAHFVLSAAHESPISGRERYTARLVPPYPIQAPQKLVKNTKEEHRQFMESLRARARQRFTGEIGCFKVVKKEYPEGSSVQVVCEAKKPRGGDKRRLYVMSAGDYDYIQPNEDTPFVITLLGKEGKGKPILWTEAPNYRAIAVNALKKSGGSRNAKQYKFQVIEGLI